VLSGSYLDRRENVADVDYQDARKMEAHVGSRPGSEGGFFYVVVVKQRLGIKALHL
jgi:hypothetical protein